MDMSTAMDLEAKACNPSIRVVYDLFRVIPKFGREVIEWVRVDQASALKADSSVRRVIKRIAHGDRDSAYFFPKIRAAFPDGALSRFPFASRRAIA